MARTLLENTFTANTTGFTASRGTWTITDGELQNTASQGGGADWGDRILISDDRTFTDFDLLVKLKKPSFNVQVIFRSGTTFGTGYGIQLRDANNFRLESWGSANISQANPITWSTGTYYWVRIRVEGTRIRAKVWVDGEYEPGAWAINVTSSTHSAGGIGYGGESASGTAIFNILTVRFINLRSKRLMVDPANSGFNSGINLSGAEFNPDIAGTKDTNYTYYDNSEFASIASKFPGAIIRLPVAISRLCPTIGTVNSTKGTELTDAMTLAGNNGLRVLLDLHDYGAKYITGVQRRIGSAEYTQANYVDDMEAIATYVKDHSALWGIGISNEPNNMPVATTSSNYLTSTWTAAANAACAAIKAIDPTLILTVCTDNYSGFQNLTSTYPANPFTNCDYVEIHAYFDSDNSGAYSGAGAFFEGSTRDIYYAGDTLQTCADWARANNTQLIVGEVGVPANSQGYLTMINDFYRVAQMNNDVIKAVFFWAKKTAWYVSATATDVTNEEQQAKVHNKFRGTI